MHNKSRNKRQFITLPTTRKIMYSLTMVFFRHGAWQVLVHILISLIDNTVQSKDCGIGLIQSKTLHIVSPAQDRQHNNVAHILLRVLINLQQIRSSCGEFATEENTDVICYKKQAEIRICERKKWRFTQVVPKVMSNNFL